MKRYEEKGLRIHDSDRAVTETTLWRRLLAASALALRAGKLSGVVLSGSLAVPALFLCGWGGGSSKDRSGSEMALLAEESSYAARQARHHFFNVPGDMLS